MSAHTGIGWSSAPWLSRDTRALAMSLGAGLLAKSVMESGKEEECGMHRQGPEV